MKNTIQNITSLISEKKKLYLQEGFEIIGIFGSYARGNASKFSDVDIAYKLDFDTFDKQFKGGFSKLLRIEEIKDELQKLLHLKVDLISMNSDNAFKILENFSDTDLRGISAVRNYIAHDYDSVDDEIIEDAIRNDLPHIKEQAKKLL